MSAPEADGLREIVPLGTNGFYPSHGRQTMSFLLAGDRRALLLDAGTGVGRLREPAVAARLAGVERLDVLLTHYHLDHVVGLTYLGAAWGGPVRLLAPAPPLVDAEPEEALSRLIGPPLFPLALDAFPVEVTVEPYRGDLELDGLAVRTRRQSHPGASVGLRLGDRLAYVTDTIADPETARFAEGVSWLLHEVWVDDRQAEEDPRLVAGHAAAGAVARIADQAQAGRLVPVHHHPLRAASELAALHDELRAASPVAVEVLAEGVPRTL
ncbi:MAG TPA: MBL fold metallo-hydrolase [Thermoanaerobaculia bacterium]|nr:MBL fold metallo-hydrolase [Thermoanaerobaculia bacterium]